MTEGRFDLIWLVLGITAGLIGVWLGMAGADISPVFTEAPSVAGGLGR